MSARGGDNCSVVHPRFDFPPTPLSLLLSVPNLVRCQTTTLGNADREGEREEEEIREDGILSLFSPPHTISPPLGVLIITRFCVTSLNKALPCLSQFLPASVCLHAPLQGLTIIRSTEADTHTHTHLVCLGDSAQCQCVCKYRG